MDTFLSAFWPNAAATVVGIVLGLPVALWINRLALKNAGRSTLSNQAQRLDHALQVLISAMENNQGLLGEYATVLSESKVSWRLNLDVSEKKGTDLFLPNNSLPRTEKSPAALCICSPRGNNKNGLSSQNSWRKSPSLVK